MFCLRQLDWTDLEQSWCQVCLQTHWRTCRGKRRRPQDCSSLRGSSPSNCKFLMELMISACISLITPNTHTQYREERWGGSTGSRRREGKRKKNNKRRKERKKNKTNVKLGVIQLHCYRHLRRKHTTAVTRDKNTHCRMAGGSDIKMNLMLCSFMKNKPQNVFFHRSCLCTRKPQETQDHPTMLPTETHTHTHKEWLEQVGLVFTPISLPLW